MLDEKKTTITKVTNIKDGIRIHLKIEDDFKVTTRMLQEKRIFYQRHVLEEQ